MLLSFPSVRLNYSALQNENRWNPNKSYSVGGEDRAHLPFLLLPSSLRVLTPLLLIDTPELVPGAILGPPSASVAPTSSPLASSSTATSSTSPMISPTTSIVVGHSSNSGAIAGGVVGGIAVISIVVAAVFLYLRRRPRAPSAEFVGTGTSQSPIHDTSRPLSDGGTVASSSLSGSPLAMRFYVRILASRVALRLCILMYHRPISAPPGPE